MSFPASLTTRTVKGRFVTYPAGTAAKGRVRIVLNDFMQGPTDNAFVAPFDETIPLDRNGEFSILLPATNDPQWTPSYYKITITIGEKIVRDKFQVSYDETDDLDLSDVLNLPAPTPGESYLLASSKGVAGGVAGLGSDGKVPANQLPPASGGVISWGDIEEKPATFPHDEVTYEQITDKPDLFPPVAHDHPMSNVTGLVDALGAKANSEEVAQSLNHKADLVDGVLASWQLPVSDKADVGLGSVDNTSDADKPVSTAQQTALNLKAPLSSPTFTGTVSGVSKAMVGLANADNTSDANKPVSTAQQSALDLKANLASPTLTGAPSAPTATAGTNTTQLATTGFVTTAVAPKADASAVSTALAGKADLVGGVIPSSQIPSVAKTDFLGAVSSQAAMLALAGQPGDWVTRTDTGTTWQIIGSDPTQLSSWWQHLTPTDLVQSVNGQTGPVTLGKADVGLGNVDNTADTAKPVSTAQQTALNLKAPLASPTFTGTVSGVTKSMVGLSDVDNTTDVSKPISTAVSTALSEKVGKDEERINVKNHGVVGDDVTDDTAALQALFNSLAVGASLYFPDGTYKVDGSLRANTISDLHIDFSANAWLRPTAGVALELYRCARAVLNDVKVKFTTGTTAVAGIKLTQSTRCTLSCPVLWIYNNLTTPPRGIYVYDNSYWTQIWNPHFRKDSSTFTTNFDACIDISNISNAGVVWGGDFAHGAVGVRIDDSNHCRVFGSAFEGITSGVEVAGTSGTSYGCAGLMVIGTRHEAGTDAILITSTVSNLNSPMLFELARVSSVANLVNDAGDIGGYTLRVGGRYRVVPGGSLGDGINTHIELTAGTSQSESVFTINGRFNFGRTFDIDRWGNISFVSNSAAFPTAAGAVGFMRNYNGSTYVVAYNPVSTGGSVILAAGDGAGGKTDLFVVAATTARPSTDAVLDLGDTTHRFRRLYAMGWISSTATKTANYTLTSSDGTVVGNGSSITFTLPDPTTTTGEAGRRYVAKNINSTPLSVVSAGTSKTIDGFSLRSLVQWETETFESDGTQWLIVNRVNLSKPVTPRVVTTTSSSTPTPVSTTTDVYDLSALAANATFGAPTGSPVDGQSLMIRVKDNSTARTLSWNAIYRAIGTTLPATTVANKQLYVGCRYNSTATKWDVLAVGIEP